MKNRWLLLLMTPLFTYANYDNNGFDSEELFDQAVVVEEDSSLNDENADLYTEAFYDEEQNAEELQETLIEDDEIAFAPAVPKKEQQRRVSANPSISSSTKRVKDIREHTDRPHVTQRDSSDKKVADRRSRSTDKQFVFQEQEFEDQSSAYQPPRRASRRSAQELEAYAEPVVIEQEEVQAEEEPVRQVRRQPAQQRTARAKAPVVQQEEAVEQEQPVRRQPTQQRTARAKAPVVQQEEAVEQEQSVRRQPTQQRTARAKAPVVQQEEAIEQEQPVRRQPTQQRTARAKAPVVQQGEAVEQEQPVRRQAAQQRAARAKAPVVQQEEAVEQEQPVRRQAAQRRAVRAKVVQQEEAVEQEQPVRRQAAQQRAARAKAPVVQQEEAIEQEQPVRRQPVQKKVVRSKASVAQQQKNYVNKPKASAKPERWNKKQPVQTQRVQPKQRAPKKWAVPMRNEVQVVVIEKQVEVQPAQANKAEMAVQRPARAKVAQGKGAQQVKQGVRKAQPQAGTQASAQQRPVQRKQTAQTEYEQIRAEKLRQIRAQPPVKSLRVGKRPSDE